MRALTEHGPRRGSRPTDHRYRVALRRTGQRTTTSPEGATTVRQHTPADDRPGRRRIGARLVVGVTVGSLALLSSCGKTTTIDQQAFAARLEAKTDFDAEQARCITEESFRSFDAATIRTLYEEGIGPLRSSLVAQHYGTILVACTAS